MLIFPIPVNSTVILVSGEEFKPLKTGTTIVGVKYKDGIVLAADMRTTMGNHIYGKSSRKVFEISPTIAGAWAGTVSQNQLLLKYLRSELKIHSLRTHRQASVTEAASLLRSWIYNMIRRPSMMMDISSFILGGKEKNGSFSLYDVGPDGTLMQTDDYVVNGSGMMYAIGYLERNFQPGLDEAKAIEVAVNAVDTAMQRDTASGNGIRVMIVDSNGAREVATKVVDTHAK